MSADEERALAIVTIAAVICVVIAISGLALGAPTTHRDAVPPAISTPPTTELRIVIWPTGPDGPPRERLLRCPGVTCPPQRALTMLQAPERRGPCPRTRSRGSAEALIEGRIAGRHIVRFVEQRDPCVDWTSLAPLIRTV